MGREKGGFWIAFCAVFFYPTGWLAGRSRFEGLEHIPARGGALVVANHLSHLDPVFTGLIVHRARRVPRFLAKHSLWSVPVLGQALRGTGQIPVYRDSADAQQQPARRHRALADGKIVVIYPEGTITRDPDGWPMQAAHRRRPARPDLRRPGAAGGALGHPRGLRRLQQAVPPAAAQADHRRALRAARRPLRLPRPPDRRGAAARGHRPDHGAGPRPAGRGPRASPRRPSSTGRGARERRASCAGSPSSAPGRGARRSPRSWPTPGARWCCGRGGPRSPPRSTPRHTNPDYLPGVVLPGAGHGDHRRRRPRSTGADAVVLAVPSQTLRANLEGWRDLLPAGSDAGQPGQGRRAGHAQADERGRRRGRGRARRPGRRACPARTWPARSPPRSRPPRSSPAPTTTAPSRCSTPAPPATSAPTPTPTSSAASSAARARTSSRWPAAMAVGHGVRRQHAAPR